MGGGVRAWHGRRAGPPADASPGPLRRCAAGCMQGAQGALARAGRRVHRRHRGSVAVGVHTPGAPAQRRRRRIPAPGPSRCQAVRRMYAPHARSSNGASADRDARVLCGCTAASRARRARAVIYTDRGAHDTHRAVNSMAGACATHPPRRPGLVRVNGCMFCILAPSRRFSTISQPHSMMMEALRADAEELDAQICSMCTPRHCIVCSSTP